MFLKSIGKDDDDEEEEERAGSPQLEAHLAFEVIFQVSTPALPIICVLREALIREKKDFL